MRLLSVICIAAALGACGHKKGGVSGSGGGNGGNETAKPTITAADCAAGVPATSLYRAWQTEFKSENTSLNMVFDFRNSTVLSVTNYCGFRNGNGLAASVAVNYSADASNIVVPRGASKVEEKAIGNDRVTCQVSMNAGTIRYGFENSCLVIFDPNGAKLYFLPSF